MVRAFIKLLLLLLTILCFYPPVAVSRLLSKPAWVDRLVQRCYRWMMRIAEVRISVRGEVDARRPLLIVSNHVSYLDIPVLGSVMPVCFTPKAEIGDWPFIGHICRLLGCVFIDRKAEKLHENRQSLMSVAADGKPVCVYPEASTGNGVELLPFKPGFFSLAEETYDGKPLAIQPVAVVYRSIRNLPIDRMQWPSIAWYGDMELVPHLWSFLKLGPLDVEVAFLPALEYVTEQADRKELAALSRQAVAQHIETARKEFASLPYRKRFLPSIAWSKSK